MDNLRFHSAEFRLPNSNFRLDIQNFSLGYPLVSSPLSNISVCPHCSTVKRVHGIVVQDNPSAISAWKPTQMRRRVVFYWAWDSIHTSWTTNIQRKAHTRLIIKKHKPELHKPLWGETEFWPPPDDTYISWWYLHFYLVIGPPKQNESFVQRETHNHQKHKPESYKLSRRGKTVYVYSFLN